MKKALLILLAVVMLLSLCACGEKENKIEYKKEPTSVSAYKSVGEREKLQGQLTWEGLNSFPIKSADMSIDELRSLCVDFFRYTKTALWIPDTNYDMTKNGKVTNSIEGEQVYGGLPYVGVASGNMYRLMDYMDESTGVVNVQLAGKNPELFGNQCSIGAWWGWARVINSANYLWTYNCVTSENFPYLGERLYEDDLKQFDGDYGTDEVVRASDMQTLFENYALLKKGDGIVYYTTAGHVVMIASDAHVERTADGLIDAGKSYVTVIDQTGEWVTGVNEFGESFNYEANVDTKWTFLNLYAGNYLPFTYHEFLGDDPVEETEISFSHTGETITKEQLYASGVKANYGIADLYAIIHDQDGNELLKVAARAERANMKELTFTDDPEAERMVQWGRWEDLSEKDEHTVTIVAQLGTGERPTLWEGKLAK